MKNQLSMVWGVKSGRQVGKVTRRFHKRRPATELEQSIIKSHGVNAKEARKLARYAKQYHASQTLDMRAADALECMRQTIEREHRAALKAQREETARLERVAAYLASE